MLKYLYRIGLFFFFFPSFCKAVSGNHVELRQENYKVILEYFIFLCQQANMCSREHIIRTQALAWRDSTWPNLGHFEHQKRIVTIINYIGRKIHEFIVILRNEKCRGKWKWHYQKCHVANVQGTIELENHHFTTTRVIIDSGKNHQWVLKSLVKGCWLDRCLLAQCSPHGLLIFYKRETTSFWWKDLVDTVLTKWSNLASPVLSDKSTYLPVDEMQCHLNNVQSESNHEVVVLWVIL